MPFGEAPEKAKHFVLLHRRLAHSVPAEDLDDYPEERQHTEGECTAARCGGKAIIEYQPGDELPADVAREIWSAFGDRIAALDGNGMRLDSPIVGERRPFGSPAANAIQKWKDGEGVTP